MQAKPQYRNFSIVVMLVFMLALLLGACSAFQMSAEPVDEALGQQSQPETQLLVDAVAIAATMPAVGKEGQGRCPWTPLGPTAPDPMT